ncbi:hypothetical protein P2318_32605 [Myxococcaceae bacterium GXIMD 01537]
MTGPMLSLLLVLTVMTQVPCAPSDMTLVCFCKQGRASACEALRTTDPRLAEAIEGLVRAVPLREQVKRVEEAKAEAASSASEPHDCKGQKHHVISRPIAKALSDHPVLRGQYEPRDPRFVAQAKDVGPTAGTNSGSGTSTWRLSNGSRGTHLLLGKSSRGF